MVYCTPQGLSNSRAPQELVTLLHMPQSSPTVQTSSDAVPQPLTLLSLTSTKTPVVAKACPPSSHPTPADAKGKTSTPKRGSLTGCPVPLSDPHMATSKEGRKQELEDHRAQVSGWKGHSLGLGWRAAPPQLRCLHSELSFPLLVAKHCALCKSK